MSKDRVKFDDVIYFWHTPRGDDKYLVAVVELIVKVS